VRVMTDAQRSGSFGHRQLGRIEPFDAVPSRDAHTIRFGCVDNTHRNRRRRVAAAARRPYRSGR